jgi:EAL domain-containing protein (putative c-di-GMP-specific phosphodiesterase class I)
MDEPVRHLVAESDLDFSPQCADVRQLMDSTFLLELDLAEALRMRTLRVDYQPQFDLGSGRGCGVEALSRWVRSTGEVISPSVFIRIAERSGLIRTLGEWVLQSACVAAGAWCSRPTQQTTLSVNVSALQIDEGFCGIIERILKQTGFPAKQLELEITESALMANVALSIEYLNAWKQLGVRIAMDDFGTGYSSLSSLSRLPVDRLKLDRSLIHRMTVDRKGAAVVRLIVSLGAELDMEVIAEGVETEEQLQMLTDLGCRQAQGYLLGRPMAAEQAQAALAKTWGNRATLPRAHVAKSGSELQRIYRSAAFLKGFNMSPYEVQATRRLGSDA